MKKLLFWLLLLQAVFTALQAQPITIIRGDCGTPTPAIDILRRPGLTYRNQRQEASSQLFKMYVHIFRNNNGSNAACTLQQIEDEVKNFMNPDYSGASTCFAIVGYEFINNTHLNTDCNTDSAADQQAVLINDRSDCINIYCHASGLKASTNTPGVYISLNGNAYSIPSNHVSINIGNNILGGVRTLAHETGHALGLYHTFERAFGDELVNGSQDNRRTKGDKISDTDADPYPDKYDSAPEISFAAGCIFTGTAKDANNTIYRPPVRNTMSYYHHFAGNGCQRNQLTPGQFVRIDSVTGVTSFLQNSLAPTTVVLTNATITSGEQRTAGLTSVTVGRVANGGNYTLSGSHVALIRSGAITLVPGTFIQPGGGGLVSFTPTTCQ